MSEVAVAHDLDPSVKILEQTYAEGGQMAIRIVAGYDFMPLNPEAVIILPGVAG